MFISKPYSFLFLFILLYLNPAAGQPLKRLSSTSYNINEGLLHSRVVDFAEDGNGFIWISTGSAVQRFDGSVFYGISAGNDNKCIPDDKYVTFFRLRNGNIWLIHAKGISEYNINTNRFRNIYLSANSVKNITPVIEAGDKIWCRDNNKKYLLFDKKTLRFTDSIYFPLKQTFQNIAFFNAQSNARYFIGLGEKELFILNESTKKYRLLTASSLQQQFKAVTYYKGDTILVATKRGIEKMNIHSGKFLFISAYKTKMAAEVANLYIKLQIHPKGYCLVSEGQEIYELDIGNGKYISKLVNLQNRNFFNAGFITNLFTDSYANVWIISENDGICKINYSFTGFKYYGTADKRKNFIKTVYVDKTENLVICGTAENGLLIFDSLEQIKKVIDHFPGAKAPYTIGAIFKRSAYNYLVFLAGGWKAYNLDTRDFTLHRVKLDSSKIRFNAVFDYHMSVFKVSDTESIMQNSFSVYKLKWLPGSAVSFEELADLPEASTGSYTDRHQQLWIGSKGKYYLFQHGSSSYKTFELPEKILVRSFYNDKAGYIWMGTEKGLFKLNAEGDIIKIFYKADGLSDENIYAICEDKKGNLWFSHNKGISCKNGSGAFFHYNKSDGLQENEFNGNSLFAAADGELFFGGVNGVSSFYPDNILRFEEQPKLFVTSVKVKGAAWETDTASWHIKEISLPWHNNSLGFEFTAMGPRKPDQYIYQYRMKGIEGGWINGNNLGYARYTLAPGKYIFEMYAGNSYEKEAAPLKKISITVHSPFWKTPVFIFSAVLLLALITILLTRYFTRLKLKRRIAELESKRALDEERLRISREMHDDIGAGLTQITMMSEAAKTNLLKTEGQQPNVKAMDKIAITSRKLVNDMSEIIWSMNPEQSSLDQFFAYLREQLRNLLEYSGLEYKIDFPENGSQVLLSNVQKRNLVLVTKETVHNAIKHSKAAHISINAEQKKSLLQFIIRDDGCGFDTKVLTHGNGLKNIRKRIAELGGRLNIESSSAGSVFIFEIPL